MRLTKISKILYLVLIVGIITIIFVIFLQSKLPAQEKRQSTTQTVTEPTTSSDENQSATQPSTSSDESQVDTPEFEIYKNEKYMFEFKYPKIYEKFKDCGLREKDEIIYLGNRIQLQIKDSQGLSLNEYVNQYINRNLHPGLVDEYKSKDVLINENYAISITYRLTGIGRFGEIVFLLHEGKVYEFSFLAGPSCIKDILELETLQQILSTFKFIAK